MSLWIISLIKCPNLHFSIRCGTYNSHLHIAIFPSSWSPSIHHPHPLSRSSFIRTHLYLYCRCRTQRNPRAWTLFVKNTSTQGASRTLHRTSAMILVRSRGELGGPPTSRKSNQTTERDTTLLPKTLRQWVYGSSHLKSAQPPLFYLMWDI